jgi:Protein of unknown function (DUF3089)
VKKTIGGVALAAVLAILTSAAPASAKTTWLCRPGIAHNPCDPSLKTTIFSSFGQRTGVVQPTRSNPKVDCFYVYPTVSDQKKTVATKTAEPAVRDIALYQAARFSQVCRVFAPLYRQITVQGLSSSATTTQRRLGDADITAAWKEYLARYNKGRGFVLIGHSQGTSRLIGLIQKQIDGNRAVRRRLLSAILLGGNVTVRKGSDRGGSFKNIAACRSSTQLGCVVAYSSFNATPPDDSIFGRAADPNQEVLCTNPAALGGGSATLDSIIPSKPYARGSLIGAGIQLLRFPLPKVSTPFLEATAAFSAQCETGNNANVLQVTSLPGTPTPTPSPSASWGLHLMDMNVAQGDLVKLVRSEAKAFEKPR